MLVLIAFALLALSYIILCDAVEMYCRRQYNHFFLDLVFVFCFGAGFIRIVTGG